jgi:hypothetical protein
MMRWHRLCAFWAGALLADVVLTGLGIELADMRALVRRATQLCGRLRPGLQQRAAIAQARPRGRDRPRGYARGGWHGHGSRRRGRRARAQQTYRSRRKNGPIPAAREWLLSAGGDRMLTGPIAGKPADDPCRRIETGGDGNGKREEHRI